MYIDIHTHRSYQFADVLAVQSVYEDFSQVEESRSVSIGLHPWYLQEAEQAMEELRKYAGEGNVLAIGECGLDRVCNTPWQRQLHYFRLQVDLSMHIHKPLIIHCVRAFAELIHELKTQKYAQPLIMHGFNNRWPLAQPLIAEGYYLSFGPAILREGSMARQVIKQVPANRLFLETDDKDISIRDIYSEAALLRQTTVEAVILQAQENFRTVFNI